MKEAGAAADYHRIQVTCLDLLRQNWKGRAKFSGGGRDCASNGAAGDGWSATA